MNSNSEPVLGQQSTNGLAVASLVLGILCLGGLGSILAIVFGYIARKQIDSSNDEQKGRRLATAGIVLGWLLLGLVIVAVAILAAVGHSSTTAKIEPANSNFVGNTPGVSVSKTDPKAAGTLLTKALHEQVTGNVAQAKKDFTEVVRLDPHNKFGYYNLGLIEQTQGSSSDAENQYRLALKIDNKYAPALYNLGILRAQTGATAEAIDLYRRAIVSDPKLPQAHFNLGLLLRGSGNIAEGNSEVQAAVRLDSSLASNAIAQGVPLPGK